MNIWNNGYVSEIDYTHGYYHELNPVRLKLLFLNKGLQPPSISTACELGFGQGLSVNIHAAASTARWFGNDFNPSQAAFAQSLAKSSKAGSVFSDDDFETFSNRQDLPDFDYIGLHGIWSWVSDENRKVIVNFIRKKLKIGGVLYISYNTLPGWSSFAPIRHLLTQHAQTLGLPGQGIITRIDHALDFTKKFLDSKPLYRRANPLVSEKFEKLLGQNKNYLAHEYFNKDWHPMYFSTMADILEAAKVQYACSAHHIDHVDTVNLAPEHQKALQEIVDPNFRETLRDFMTNQQFRRDIWVKGASKISLYNQVREFRSLKFILIRPKSEITLKVSGSLGEADLSKEIYEPILDKLSNYQSITIGQLEHSFVTRGVTLAQIIQAIMILCGSLHVAMVQDEENIQHAKQRTSTINRHICELACGGNDIKYLASPVTGGGIPVGRFQQLFLLSISQGNKQASEWAQFAWQILASQGQKILKDGKTLETAEENLAELTSQAQEFADKQLPILKALQIA